MHYFIFLVSFIIVTQTSVAQDRNYISFEYAPFSKHLSDDDAPAGGYNEDNNIASLKYGRMYPLNEKWDYSLTAGITSFKNSYDKQSNGAGVGVEWLYDLQQNWDLYGGADLGLVSGYEDNVDDSYHLFGDLIPFFVLNGGAEYEFASHLPTFRAGLKYVPASLVGSDDVIAVSIGTRYRF